MSMVEDDLAARFAALAPEPLAGDWDDVLGRAGMADKARRRRVRVRALAGSRRRRFAVLAVAALAVIVGTASAFDTVRALFFGSSASVVSDTPVWSPDGREIAFLAYRDPDGPTEVYVMDSHGGGRQRNLTREWGRSVLSPPPRRVPIWSPDWRRVAFVSDPCAGVQGACSRTSQLYVMNADGSELRRLARGGKVRRDNGQWICPCAPTPVWSPDGQKIAFGSERDGTVDVYVVNIFAGGRRRLTRSLASEESLAWSPDSRKLAFVKRIEDPGGPPRRKEIWVMNADGSGQQQLARGSAPAWSPRGRQIAFRSDHDGNGEIYVMNADGSEQRRLTRNPASDGGPVWNPPGTKIAFERFGKGNTDIYVMNADGSRLRNLTPARRPPRRARDGSPAWSPDGRIAFTSTRDGNGEIYVMNADGSGQTNLTQLKRTRLSRAAGNVSFSFNVPSSNWAPGPSAPGTRFNGQLYVSQDAMFGQAAEAVVYWGGFPDGDGANPCAKLRSVGPSIADLATAVATAPGIELLRAPTDVTVGGRPAKHVVVAVREDVGCGAGFFYAWPDERWGPFWGGAHVGDTIRVWIVDVNGSRLFLGAGTTGRTGSDPDILEQLEQEIQGIVDSIRFD